MAIEFMKQGNKESASACLRKEKMLDSELTKLYNCKLILENQLMNIEQVINQHDIMDAMRTTNNYIRSFTNEDTQEKAEKLMEEIRDSVDSMNEIGHILSSSIGPEIDISQELEDLQISTSQVVSQPQFVPLAPIPETIKVVERQPVAAYAEP